MTSEIRTALTDLSHPLRTGMPVFPGDPEVQVEEVLTTHADGCSVRSLQLGTHSGTHVDAPSHTVAGGRTVDEIALDELTGRAQVAQLPDLAPGERVSAEMLGEALGSGLDRVAPVVLIATGWDRHWGTDDYFRHPVLTGEAASALVDSGMHVLGVDTPSPDGLDDDALTSHGVILGADRLIIENLRGLVDLPRFVDFTAFPLSIAGGDGAPVRAVARRKVTGGEDRRGNSTGRSE